MADFLRKAKPLQRQFRLQANTTLPASRLREPAPLLLLLVFLCLRVTSGMVSLPRKQVPPNLAAPLLLLSLPPLLLLRMVTLLIMPLPPALIFLVLLLLAVLSGNLRSRPRSAQAQPFLVQSAYNFTAALLHEHTLLHALSTELSHGL